MMNLQSQKILTEREKLNEILDILKHGRNGMYVDMGHNLGNLDQSNDYKIPNL